MLASVVPMEHIARVVEARWNTYRECYSMIDLNGERMLTIHDQSNLAREKREKEKERKDVGCIWLV